MRKTIATLCALVKASAGFGPRGDGRLRTSIGATMLCLGIAIGGAGLVATRASGDAIQPTALRVDAYRGDWYVLIHYRDREGEDAEHVFWDDEVWRIDGTANRLDWAIHPHVEMRDRTGRFESLPSGREARTDGAWSPSGEQLAEIRAGLVADPHEARTKTLYGSTAGGFETRGARRPTSASAIAYGEQWWIRPTEAGLEFGRRDTLASGRADPVEGTTRFTVRTVVGDADELLGDYERDGRLVGDFRMIRMSASDEGR